MIIMVEGKDKIKRQACINYLTRYFKNRENPRPITCEVASMDRTCTEYIMDYESLSRMSFKTFKEEYADKFNIDLDEYNNILSEIKLNNGVACCDLQDKLTLMRIKMLCDMFKQHDVKTMIKDKVYILNNFFTTAFTLYNDASSHYSEISREIEAILRYITVSNMSAKTAELIEIYAKEVGYPYDYDSTGYYDVEAGKMLLHHLDQICSLKSEPIISNIVPNGKVIAICLTSEVKKEANLLESTCYFTYDDGCYHDDAKYVCLRRYFNILAAMAEIKARDNGLDNSPRYYEQLVSRSDDDHNILYVANRAIGIIEKDLNNFIRA